MIVLLYSFCIVLVAGVLGVVPIDSGNVPIYFIDILAGISLLAVFVRGRIQQTTTTKRILLPFLLFTSIAFFSLLLSSIPLFSGEWFVSALYLLRWVAYFSIFLLVRDQNEVPVLCRLRIVGIILAMLGWMQYILYPNLRNLEYLGWDPHLQRIFSTYLDPNFFGLMMVLSIVLWWITLEKKRAIRMAGVAVLFVTLLFTYSRSSYLSLIGAVLTYSFYSRRWVLSGMLILAFVIAVFTIPKPSGEGGKILRLFTAEARLENWQTGMEIFRDHPVFGVGFNTLRYAKMEYLPEQKEIESSNSGAGLDNSFLFVAATTGAVGLAAFLFFIFSIFRQVDTLGKIVLVAVLVHSVFQNSFFFPWVLAWMWLVLGASSRHGE